MKEKEKWTLISFKHLQIHTGISQHYKTPGNSTWRVNAIGHKALLIQLLADGFFPRQYLGFPENPYSSTYRHRSKLIYRGWKARYVNANARSHLFSRKMDREQENWFVAGNRRSNWTGTGRKFILRYSVIKWTPSDTQVWTAKNHYLRQWSWCWQKSRSYYINKTKANKPFSRLRTENTI